MARQLKVLKVLSVAAAIHAGSVWAQEIYLDSSPSQVPTPSRRKAEPGIWKAVKAVFQEPSTDSPPAPQPKLEPEPLAPGDTLDSPPISGQVTKPHDPEIIVVPEPTSPYHPTQWRAWPGTASAPSSDSSNPAGWPAPVVWETHTGKTLGLHDFWHSRPDCWFSAEALGLRRDRGEGGTLVYRGVNSVLDRSDLDAGTEWGPGFAVGKRLSECVELQVSGFWVGSIDHATYVKGAFSLSMPVSNPPFGFDDFGQDASLISVNYETEVGSVEVMWRSWGLLGDPCCCPGCGSRCSGQSLKGWPLSVALGIGVRYMDLNEQFSVYSQLGPVPSPTGLQDYLYNIHADNDLLGCQFEVYANTGSWNDLDFVFDFKCMLAANIIDTSVSLREFVGNTAFHETRNEVSFAQVLSFGAYLRWRPVECAEFRAGYNFLWVNGYAGASDQFSRDLSRPGQFDDSNSILLHGPSLILTFNF